MKKTKWGMLILLMALAAACSSTPIDHTKPEMSVQDRGSQPPRTFNQFHKEWDYN